MHTVLDGDPAPPTTERGTAAPTFEIHGRRMQVHVYCGQMAGWIKMPLGTEVGLGPGDIVLDGNSDPPPPKGHSPNFRPMSVVAKRLNGSRCYLVGR